jgi:hypothetical protein
MITLNQDKEINLPEGWQREAAPHWVRYFTALTTQGWLEVTREYLERNPFTGTQVDRWIDILLSCGVLEFAPVKQG